VADNPKLGEQVASANPPHLEKDQRRAKLRKEHRGYRMGNSAASIRIGKPKEPSGNVPKLPRKKWVEEVKSMNRARSRTAFVRGPRRCTGDKNQRELFRNYWAYPRSKRKSLIHAYPQFGTIIKSSRRTGLSLDLTRAVPSGRKNGRGPRWKSC